jgi:hypothetical protein
VNDARSVPASEYEVLCCVHKIDSTFGLSELHNPDQKFSFEFNLGEKE